MCCGEVLREVGESVLGCGEGKKRCGERCGEMCWSVGEVWESVGGGVEKYVEVWGFVECMGEGVGKC